MKMIEVGQQIWRMKWKSRPLIKKRIQQQVKWDVVQISTGIVISYFAIGLVSGFGNNPTAVTVRMVLANLARMLFNLVAGAVIRNYLIYRFIKDIHQKKIVIIGLFMGCLNIWWMPLIQLETNVEKVIWAVGSVVPKLIISTVATYLMIYGGVVSSILYLLITQISEWISPILPNINGFTTGIFKMITALMTYYLITLKYKPITKGQKMLRKSQTSLVSRGVISGLGVVILCFSVGLLNVYPSVILSGSMRPDIEVGDVLVVNKLKNEEDMKGIKKGDIIQFEQEGVLVSHRVVEIDEESKNTVYYTKGDNNVSVDSEVVRDKQIKGKVIGVVPKVGWIHIVVRKGLGFFK